MHRLTFRKLEAMGTMALGREAWNSLTEEFQQLERALEQERSLRERAERQLAEKARQLSDSNERLAAERTRLGEAMHREQDRLDEELALAKDIQSSLLPRDLTVEEFEIAAVMLPCVEVGGDYYDVRPIKGGCWIGIGDVSGHGVSAGLVMLMVQSVAAALIGRGLGTRPSDVLARLNEVLYENLRGRMASDAFVTASLLRFHADGRVAHAGAHEDLVLLRAETGRCERIETSGVWLGVLPDIHPMCTDQYISLRPGDVLVLYTDGLTEAMNTSGELFGLERVCAELERLRDTAPQVVLDHLLASVTAFAGSPSDDLTILVLRYRGEGCSGP